MIEESGNSAMRRFLRKLMPIAVLAGGVAISVGAAGAQDLRTVKIGWPAAIASNLAHVNFGEELGFFSEEGLKPEVTVMQGAFNVVQQVLAGGFDTGYVGVEAAVTGLQPGSPELPMLFIYNYLRQSIWEIAVPADSKIQSIADLKGKTVGIGGLAFGNVPGLRAAIVASGLHLSDVDLLPVGVGAPAFRALTTGKIDALNLWDTMNATLEQTGFALRRLDYPKQFRGNPSHGLIATNALIKDDPKFIGQFGRAWAKSIVACNANVDGCLIAFWKTHPELKPDLPLAQAIEKERPILQARLAKLLYFEKGQPHLHGSYSDEDWKGVISALKVGGEITITDLPYDRLYTNQFVKAFNDFDTAQVEASARAYK